MFRFLLVTSAIMGIAPSYAGAQDTPDIDLEALYIADVMHNSGGVEDGTVYLDNLGLAATAEFGNGIEAHASLLYNNGNSLAELTGDSFAVSNIETGVEALRLYEAWLSGNVSAGTHLKAGFFDVNSEFDVLDSSGIFVGSSHGIGMDIGQTGENGPSIFPVPGLAFRVQQQVSDDLLVRAAIIEGTPGDPDRPKRTALKLGDGEGAFLIGEVEKAISGGKILAGAWTYTAERDTWDGGADNNYGIYLRGETTLKETDDGVITGFGRLGLANEGVNDFSGFASLGLNYARENGHEAGISIAHAPASNERVNVDGGETVVELTYAWPIHENLTIQPDFQYIFSPSADPAVDDAQVFGVRFIASLSN